MSNNDQETFLDETVVYQYTAELGEIGCIFRERSHDGSRLFEKIPLTEKALKRFFLLVGLENIKKIMEEK